MSLLRRVLTGAFDYGPPAVSTPLRVVHDAPLPSDADYLRLNELLGHTSGCRCSTCELGAGLGAQVRQQEGLQ